jgi:hypothetical protein
MPADLDIARLTEAMMSAAAIIESDEQSVLLSRAANRLAHQGAVCEAPLTPDEMSLINDFMKEHSYDLSSPRPAPRHGSGPRPAGRRRV